MDEPMTQDIMTMLECYKECTKNIAHCLEMGGQHARPEHINLLLDCAAICKLAADFAIRGSANHPAICKLCADICRQCADQCELIGDDEDMQKCAEKCRECVEVCERMSKM